MDCFPDQQQALLGQLAAHPQQQFAFLKSLVALHQQAAGGGGGAGPLQVMSCRVISCTRMCRSQLSRLITSSLPLAALLPARLLQASSRSPALAALLGDMAVANTYLRLLCEYEPRSGALEGGTAVPVPGLYGGRRPAWARRRDERETRTLDRPAPNLCMLPPALPPAVLAYLQSHDAYSVDECLQQCLDRGIQVGGR